MPDPGVHSPTAYDSVPYPGYAYTQTHPDRIATLARLSGVATPAIETCSVLEIGCGDGANLIPMALGLPGAQFHGMDLASQPIARAQDLARELAVTNVSFSSCNILDLPDRYGEFDYIIAHGFYSWVPVEARDKLMAICQGSLSPKGVAFVSYNTMPGGHLRRMLREILLFHVENAPDPSTKVRQAQAVLGFLGKLATGGDEYEVFLKTELERASKYDPGYFFHDDLAPINDPCYLHEFVAHGARFGLRFLGDLNSSFVHAGNLDDQTRAAVDELRGNPVMLEQYLDFARCRRFRQTLLCREEVDVAIEPDLSQVPTMLISSSAAPVSDEPELRSDKIEEFRGGRNAWMRTGHPILKSAMMALHAAWPSRLTFEALRERVGETLGASPAAVPVEPLVQGIFDAFSMRALDLHVWSPRIAAQAGPKPRASRLARGQTGRGTLITNLLHGTAKVDQEPRRRILSLLDGSRDWPALAAEAEVSAEELSDHLTGLARLGLLEE